MDLVVYDDDEQRYVPWAVAVGAVLLVALVTAALTFVLARQASGEEDQPLGGIATQQPATAPSAEPSPAPSAAPGEAPADSPTAAPGCVAALLRADAVLERAAAVNAALAEHTAIMDELLAERIDAEEALDRTLPVLTDGATDRRLLEEGLAAYAEERADCPS